MEAEERRERGESKRKGGDRKWPAQAREKRGEAIESGDGGRRGLATAEESGVEEERR